MIPTRFIIQWRANAPWAFDRQIEQDLIISRALIELFSDPLIAESVAFRGGTALYKLFVEKPARFIKDMEPLLVSGLLWDVRDAANLVNEKFLSLLPGEAWKGVGQ